MSVWRVFDNKHSEPLHDVSSVVRLLHSGNLTPNERALGSLVVEVRGGLDAPIIISSTALGGPRPPQANVANNLYPGNPPASFYNPVSLRLPLPPQSILISVGHILDDLQSLSTISF